MSTTTINLTSQQRRTGRRGVETRLARAAVRDELQSLDTITSRERAAGMLAAPPAGVGGMSCLALLRACRWCGETRARTMLRHARVPETKTVRELTPRQRAALRLELVGGAR